MLTLRHYVEKGGFLIFDDFRGGHWYNFEAQMSLLLPEGRLVQLDISHPIFHAFFEIETLDFVPFYGRGGLPTFHGVFEDNDPSRRLLLIANYNNDIGEYWEYSDTGFTADRAVERGVQARRELRDLFNDALTVAGLKPCATTARRGGGPRQVM